MLLDVLTLWLFVNLILFIFFLVLDVLFLFFLFLFFVFLQFFLVVFLVPEFTLRGAFERRVLMGRDCIQRWLSTAIYCCARLLDRMTLSP